MYNEFSAAGFSILANGEAAVPDTAVTTSDLGLTVITTVAGPTAAAAPTLEAVYTFHHNLARSLAGYNDVKIVTSRPESGNWVLIFTSPTDAAPTHRRVTWDMTVFQVQTDAAGVVWLLVNQSPPMWVLADQTKAKAGKAG